jgi:hypothetical protein
LAADSQQGSLRNSTNWHSTSGSDRMRPRMRTGHREKMYPCA